ncbi:MAG TPA: ATP-binding protein [Gemmatimonadaceae bacterium]|nr:ATP-binding protein [Gemmatimonadaceae bacterium]
MTFRLKLLLGFSVMILPALFIGAEAIRTNALERAALEELGQHMARTTTYAELEGAIFNESATVWRFLTGMDPTARQEFRLNSDVVNYWQQRWRAELRPEEMGLADTMQTIQGQISALAAQVFALYDSGKRVEAYGLAQRELRDRLVPVLTAVNRDVYRQVRESSVRGAYSRLADILAAQRRAQLAILALALVAGLVTSWAISQGLARPISELSRAMGVAGSGDLAYRVNVRSSDEIGDLARSFAQMTERLTQSRAELVGLNSELAAKVALLERTQAKLVQSERLASVGEMSAAVAHGIRNPLASLRAAAQLAQRHSESGPSRDYLTSIIDEVDRLDRRVSHLLSFSRPAPFHPLRESVNRLVEELVVTVGELLRERGVELRLEMPPVPPVRVDPMQVEQALLEIVSNAMDAMPDGGRLRISTRSELGADGPGSVVIEIADTGGGIPEHLLPSVCDPFFTTRPEGTGLGLAVAKRFVEQNGGRLEIESTPGTGTVVRIRLPATKDDPQNVDSAPTTSGAAAG